MSTARPNHFAVLAEQATGQDAATLRELAAVYDRDERLREEARAAGGHPEIAGCPVFEQLASPAVPFAAQVICTRCRRPMRKAGVDGRQHDPMYDPEDAATYPPCVPGPYEDA